jgi:hypothetical protein
MTNTATAEIIERPMTNNTTADVDALMMTLIQPPMKNNTNNNNENHNHR